jgi:hypothetical protein
MSQNPFPLDSIFIRILACVGPGLHTLNLKKLPVKAGDFFFIIIFEGRFGQFSARQCVTSKDGGQAEVLRNEV